MENWYGIKGIQFVWHGEWSDPEVCYLGVSVNAPTVEDTMWYEWTHDDDGNYLPERSDDDNGFARYMRANASLVKDLIRMAMQPKAYLNLMGDRGYGILEGFCGAYNDSVIVGSNSDTGWTDIHEYILHENAKGEYYFTRFGKRYYINDFVRC